MVALGGRIAEEIFYGKEGVSIGASQDYQVASGLAKEMVEKWGMSSYTSSYSRIGGKDTMHKDISDETHYQLEKETKEILDEAYNSAKDILEKRSFLIKFIARILIEVRNLTGNKFNSLIDN